MAAAKVPASNTWAALVLEGDGPAARQPAQLGPPRLKAPRLSRHRRWVLLSLLLLSLSCSVVCWLARLRVMDGED